MTLRTAVVGGGTVSGVHLDGLAACPLTELVAICDLDEDRARENAAAYDIAAYTDVDYLLGNEEPDWLHVCTPVQTHLDIAKAAIESGVPVQIEKPITTDMAEFEELAAAAEEHDVPVSAVHNHDFDPVVRRLKERLEDGDLGPVRAVDLTYTGETYPDDVRRGEWAFELAGGEFEEGLPHPVYLLLHVGGYPASTDAIQVTTQRAHEYERGFSYDGTGFQYRTPSGTLCSATLLASEVPDKTVTVHCESGTLVADIVSQTLVTLDRDYEASSTGRALNNLDQAGDRLSGTMRNASAVLGRLGEDDWETMCDLRSHYYQFDAEARALLDGTDLPVPLAEARWTTEIVQAIREAAAREREVQETQLS
jgi:predicted dehydrogenase